MRMIFRTIVSGFLCLVLAQCAPAQDAYIEAKRPNIIFVLLDDMGWADPGFQGSKIKTPTLDALARTSVVLQRSYVFPICSPTRAALMTGLNPLRYGVDGPMKNDAGLSLDLTLMPEIFREAGYDTQMVGKWHLGMATPEEAPDGRGFNNFYGMLGGFSDYYRHSYFGGYDLQRDGVSDRSEGYLTDLLTREAVRIIDAAADGEKPLFLYLSYTAPHTPLQYPPGMKNTYGEIENRDRQVYAQMLTYWDTSFAEVLEALEDNAMTEDTIVVVLSDNGGLEAEGASNAPLRGGKGDAFEGGIRSPTIVSWPGTLAKPQQVQIPVFITDWLPTLLDAVGVDYDAQRFDGQSKWASIARPTSQREGTLDPVIVGSNKARAVFDWPYKLVRTFRKPNSPQQDYLFNILEDPEEQTDLFATETERVSALREIMNSIPAGESKGNKGPPPETLFKNADGTNNFDYRMEETCAPWAEAARGKSDLPGCKG